MCLNGHSHGKKHRCIDTCKKCRQTSCEPGEPVTCVECNVTCVSNVCYLKHKSGSKSACDIFWECLKCHRRWERKERRPDQHVCGEWLCPCCTTWIVDPNHRCYLRRVEANPMSDKYVFFDFEAVQETERTSQIWSWLTPAVQRVSISLYIRTPSVRYAV